MNTSNSARDPVEKLAEEFAERFRRGERPSLTEYTTRYPDFAEQIRDLFPALVVMEQFGSVAEPGQEISDSSILVGPRIPRQLGEFRILREVGRGGMGVVFEAVQESLGRHVALKVLAFQGIMKPTYLERFSLEACAAARLHHSNIVPVFGIGEHQGIHYYAMQFIQGQGLDLVLKEVRQLRRRQPASEEVKSDPCRELTVSIAHSLITGQTERPLSCNRDQESQTPKKDRIAPADAATSDSLDQRIPPTISDEDSGLAGQPQSQYFRSVALLGAQVAEALDYAHKQGILHRDIKPSNLLLDTRGTVWITDFGLVKTEGSDELTHSGDIVGTVRFMAPERFQGKTDPRNDVYSLGITLYEMLTLRPAFEDNNRARLIERIVHEDPPRPRKLNPQIPRDLETIVLKAIAKEPARRYSTAGDMADDLRRFLADRPIRARRASSWERSWRWCRRNPVVATLTAFVALLMLVIVIGSSLSAVRLGTEARRAKDAERDAQEKLWQSKRDQARAGRMSRQLGQRLVSFQALREAAEIARKLEVPDDRLLNLRNEAIASLALPDLKLAKEWRCDILAVDFDSTLERYAALNLDGTISLRRIAGDAEIYRFPGLGSVGGLAFSPDGQYLAQECNGRFKIWKLSGSEPFVVTEEHNVSAWAFGPDSRQYVIGFTDRRVRLCQLPSTQCQREFQVGDRPRNFAFDPRHPRLAIAYARVVQVSALDQDTVLAQFPQESSNWPKVAWHPQGQILATTDERFIYLWDVAGGKQIAKMEGHKHGGIGFSFSHSGDLLASAAWDGILRLWDTRSGRELFHTHANMWVLRFSPDDHFLAGDNTGHGLRIWEMVFGNEYRTLVQDPILTNSPMQTSSCNPDGRLLAAGMNEGFGIWDSHTGKQLSFTKQDPITHVLFEPSGSLLTNSGSGLLRWPVRWDKSSPGQARLGPPQRLALPGSSCQIAQSHDGLVIASAQMDGALLLTADHHGQALRLRPHGDVRYVAVSPDGKWAATGSHGSTMVVKIWETGAGKLVKTLRTGAAGTHVAFDPNGRWLATGGDYLRIWEVGTWQEKTKIDAKSLHPFAFSPDGRMLALETGLGIIQLVEAESGREFARLENADRDRAMFLTFSPDGARLIFTSNDSQSIHVWDLRAIRRQLEEIGLDWDLPAYPPPSEENANMPLKVEVDITGLVTPRSGVEAFNLNNKAWQLATHPDPKQRDPHQAVELGKKAVALAPESGNARNTLGVAYYRAGEWKAAVTELNKSLGLLNGNVESFNTFFLAMAHWQLGQKDKARQYYDRAVKWLEENKESIRAVKHYQEELGRFRAEAEELLGIKSKKIHDNNTQSKGEKQG